MFGPYTHFGALRDRSMVSVVFVAAVVSSELLPPMIMILGL